MLGNKSKSSKKKKEHHAWGNSSDDKEEPTFKRPKSDRNSSHCMSQSPTPAKTDSISSLVECISNSKKLMLTKDLASGGFSYDPLQFPRSYELLLSAIVKMNGPIGRVEYQCKMDGEEIRVGITEDSFEDFLKYCVEAEHKMIKLHVSKPTPVAQALRGKTAATDTPSSKSKDPKKKKIDYLAEWKKVNFDPKFPMKLKQTVRAELLRALVHENSVMKSVNGHSIRVMKSSVSFPGVATIMSIFTPQEIQAFFRKRADFAVIYKNEFLALNPLWFQCCLCSGLISLGNINNIIHTKDKIVDHMEKIHSSKYLAEKKKTTRSLLLEGALLLDRNKKFLENNFNCTNPRVRKCERGLIHSFLDIKADSKVPHNPFITKPAPLRYSFFECNSSCESMTDQSASPAEFQKFAEAMLPYYKVKPVNEVLLIRPNSEVTVRDKDDVERNGMLGKSHSFSFLSICSSAMLTVTFNWRYLCELHQLIFWPEILFFSPLAENCFGLVCLLTTANFHVL